jgi:hypothetical protein
MYHGAEPVAQSNSLLSLPELKNRKVGPTVEEVVPKTSGMQQQQHNNASSGQLPLSIWEIIELPVQGRFGWQISWPQRSLAMGKAVKPLDPLLHLKQSWADMEAKVQMKCAGKTIKRAPRSLCFAVTQKRGQSNAAHCWSMHLYSWPSIPML